MKTTYLLLLCFACSLGQQQRLDFKGEIGGTLTGEDGTKIAEGSVSLRRLPPQPPRLTKTAWGATTSVGGTFRFSGLSDGDYQLCAETPKVGWLNPCEWGPKPAVITLSAGREFAEVTVVMRKAAAVPIRLEDPGRVLAANEGKTAQAVILMGVATQAGWFRPATVTSRDDNGKTYEVVIPYNASVNLSVYSPYFQLADSTGALMSRTGGVRIPISVSGGQTPAMVRLTVTGADR